MSGPYSIEEDYTRIIFLGSFGIALFGFPYYLVSRIIWAVISSNFAFVLASVTSFSSFMAYILSNSDEILIA